MSGQVNKQGQRCVRWYVGQGSTHLTPKLNLHLYSSTSDLNPSYTFVRSSQLWITCTLTSSVHTGGFSPKYQWGPSPLSDQQTDSFTLSYQVRLLKGPLGTSEPTTLSPSLPHDSQSSLLESWTLFHKLNIPSDTSSVLLKYVPTLTVLHVQRLVPLQGEQKRSKTRTGNRTNPSTETHLHGCVLIPHDLW